MKPTPELIDRIQSFVCRGFDHTFGTPDIEGKEDPEWRKVVETGTRLWLDTGDMGEAEALWVAEFSALTTNNTLLNKEIQKGIYDKLVVEAAEMIREVQPGLDESTLILEIAFILNAYHGLRLVEKFDANVSVELHTDLAQDVERSVAYGRRYFAICPERFIIKVPLTPAGYLSARRLRAEGIPLNFTLGFSARHNVVAALLTKPTYVNVFMGRLNSFVADHKLGSGDNVGEKTTLATQRALRALRDEGRTESMLIGASIRSGDQIEDLAGIDVFTMPPKAAAEFRANPPAQVSSRVENDPEISLAEGVNLDDFNGSTLWEIPDAFRACVDALLKLDIETLTPEDLQQHFQASGFGGFLPAWTACEIETISRDGKIPKLDTWKARLASGELGLDALMNVSALQSFATDQAALDDRVRSMLQGVPTA
jgi:transaldolase